MRSILLVGLAIGLVGCKAAKEKPAEEKPAAEAKKPEKVEKVETAKPDVPNSDDKLAAELEELAEMPELTAEATEEEIDRRANRFIEAVSAFFEVIVEHEDCDKMGRSLSRFADLNARFLARLQKFNDPEVSERISKLLMARGTQWINKMATNLSRCAKHPAVLGALMKMSQQQQR